MIWWVTSRLLRRQFAPMLAATRTLATLTDPGQQLPVTRRDELGELIGGFNRLLQTLASGTGVALENARLFDETQQTLQQQTASADILRAISKSPTDVAPVVEVDGKPVGSGKPGPDAGRLREIYLDEMRKAAI